MIVSRNELDSYKVVDLAAGLVVLVATAAVVLRVARYSAQEAAFGVKRQQ